MTVYALHENPEWFPPFAAAFERAGLDYEEWLLISGSLDLDATPPEGLFWNRLSASSHTRGHEHAKDYTRAVLDWLEAHERRVVNGRPVVEMEVSKVQLTAGREAMLTDQQSPDCDRATLHTSGPNLQVLSS